MALIIYPTTGWDSYVSVADADTLVTSNVIDTALWTALITAHKEVLLRQASLSISSRIIDPQEASTPSKLALAVALLANRGTTVSISDADYSKANVKRIKIDGAIEKEFFSKSAPTNRLPDDVRLLLKDFGYSTSAKILRS